MRRLPFSLVFCLVPSIAAAGGGRPLPGDQHVPRLFIDESTAMISLTTHGSAGYAFRSRVQLSGLNSTSDTARLDWKQGGKVLASTPCKLSVDAEQHWGDAACEYEGKELHAKGAIDADLIVFDDKEEKNYVVRTFKLQVGSWHEIGNTTLYQIVPDDLLAAAWVYHEASEGTSKYMRPQFRFWVAGEAKVGGTLRCTVDGVKLDDIEATLNSVDNAEGISAEHTPPKGAQAVYSWNHVQLSPTIYFGKKVNPTGGSTAGLRFLIDNPGAWDCKVRTDGKTIRELRFTVNKVGMVEQDEMQSGKRAIPTLDGTVLIDVRIPKDAGDTRVRPDAIKKTMGFGLAWPEHAKVKAIHAALPPASGLPDPK